MVFTVTTITTDIQIVHIFMKRSLATLVEKGFVGNYLANEAFVDTGRTILVMQTYSTLGSSSPKDSTAWLLKITGYFRLNAVLKVVAMNTRWQNLKNSYLYQNEKQYLAGFQLIGRRRSNELKYHIENNVV